LVHFIYALKLVQLRAVLGVIMDPKLVSILKRKLILPIMTRGRE
jgi:hypothetical protein